MFTRRLFWNTGRDACKINLLTPSRSYQIWRKRLGLEERALRYSPLTLLPDYSFVDGRPVPLSETRLKKVKLQKAYCERIIELSTELDVAIQHYNDKQKEKELQKQNIIKNKLKPKGSALKKITKK